ELGDRVAPLLRLLRGPAGLHVSVRLGELLRRGFRFRSLLRSGDRRIGLRDRNGCGGALRVRRRLLRRACGRSSDHDRDPPHGRTLTRVCCVNLTACAMATVQRDYMPGIERLAFGIALAERARMIAKLHLHLTLTLAVACGGSTPSQTDAPGMSASA